MYKSYHQIEVAEEDGHNTAILTYFRSYAFENIPMGLTSAGNTFQRFMNEVLRGLGFVYVYIDDILIFSKSREEYLAHTLLRFCPLDPLRADFKERQMCLCLPKIEFLGHEVSKGGIRPLDEKIETIRDFPKPQNVKQLRMLLGMVNFYRRFIPMPHTFCIC